MRRLLALLFSLPAVAAWAADSGTVMAPTVGNPVPVLRAAPALPSAVVVAGAPKLDKIWSAVVLATNPAVPKAAPAELTAFAPRLKKVFGYSQFQIIGSAAELVDEQNEHWLVPSQSFWLGVKVRRAASKESQGGYLLNLQLFQDKRPLLETEAKLAPGSPLFIRGPLYGEGQLIIVLQIQR